MADIAKVGNEIYNKLKDNGFKEIVDRIDYLQSIGSTGGEIVTDCAGYLVKLRNVYPEAHKLIEIDLIHYLILCAEYGIYINNSPVKYGKMDSELLTLRTFSDFSVVENLIRLLRENDIEVSFENITPRKIVAKWEDIQFEFNLNVKKEDLGKALALLNSISKLN